MTASSASFAVEDEPETAATSIDPDLSATATATAAAEAVVVTAATTDTRLAPADVDALADSLDGVEAEAQHVDDGREPEPEPEPEPESESAPDAVLRVNPADDSCYWDLAAMAPLNARSAAAIARLRAFRPPAFPTWDRLPLSRRAAVLVLLYADRRGDLRVVLTLRAATLRSFSGHAAFPGGKADTLDETPAQIARREAWEEIGLPMDGEGGSGSGGSRLPRPLRIEHLCYLPHNLAKTELVVRPVVALLHVEEAERAAAAAAAAAATAAERTDGGEGRSTTRAGTSSAGDALIPRLDAKEVAAVFTAPFHNFLRQADEVPPATLRDLRLQRPPPPPMPPGPWYEGTWIHWNDKPWRMHFFYVPVVGQRVATPKKRARSESAEVEEGGVEEEGAAEAEAEAEPKTAANGHIKQPANHVEATTGPYGEMTDIPDGRYKVWGMTARILVEAAKLAYDEKPEFPHNSHFGDEAVIATMAGRGRLGDKKKAAASSETVKEASSSKM